ncbi:MAG: hypothetical protein AAFY02_21605 [Pseudomonadota bacterium]
MAISDPLIPSKSPFNYNAGINYESWEDGRVGYSIPADLDQISQYYNLIKTFHGAAVGTADPTTPEIDPTQAEVIDYVVAHGNMELVMGTNNSALAILDKDGDWQAGYMTSREYTDAWVEMLIEAFGSTADVKSHLKTITLGNEIDANGPPPNDPSFDAYYQTWIPQAFDNLKASLNAAGLGDIPITTTIANYGTTNTVSVEIPQYISEHWKNSWNEGQAFVFFNQYTQDSQQSTDFQQVIDYFERVQSQLGDDIEVFVGETGYSSFYGSKEQEEVYQQIYSWMSGQHRDGGVTVPLFAFDAFDRPSASPPPEVSYGIFKEDKNSQPTGLKPDLVDVIPAWTTQPINDTSDGSDAYHGGDERDVAAAGDGNDILHGNRSADTLRGQSGHDLARGHHGNDRLIGAEGEDTFFGGGGRDRLAGGTSEDSLFGGPGDDFLNGGSGSDLLVGGRGDDTFLVDTASDLIQESAAGGVDLVRSSAQDYTLSDDSLWGFIENLQIDAGEGDFDARGNALDNSLLGNSGDNRLIGASGSDLLEGGLGDDTLNGGADSDRLEGGSGQDVLVLGQEDRAFGGSGADAFRFDGKEGKQNDLVIRDFSQAEGDKLVFATGLESGSFTYRGDAAFTGVGNSEARLAADGRLEVDQDGDGQVDLRARLSGISGGQQLSAGDFVWLG